MNNTNNQSDESCIISFLIRPIAFILSSLEEVKLRMSKECHSWSTLRSQSEAGRGRGAWAVQSSETERITSNNNQTSSEPVPGGSRNPTQLTQVKVSFTFCQTSHFILGIFFYTM